MIEGVGKLNMVVSSICFCNNSFNLKVLHKLGLLPSSQNRDLPVQKNQQLLKTEWEYQRYLKTEPDITAI